MPPRIALRDANAAERGAPDSAGWLAKQESRRRRVWFGPPSPLLRGGRRLEARGVEPLSSWRWTPPATCLAAGELSGSGCSAARYPCLSHHVKFPGGRRSLPSPECLLSSDSRLAGVGWNPSRAIRPRERDLRSLLLFGDPIFYEANGSSSACGRRLAPRVETRCAPVWMECGAARGRCQPVGSVVGCVRRALPLSGRPRRASGRRPCIPGG